MVTVNVAEPAQVKAPGASGTTARAPLSGPYMTFSGVAHTVVAYCLMTMAAAATPARAQTPEDPHSPISSSISTMNGAHVPVASDPFTPETNLVSAAVGFGEPMASDGETLVVGAPGAGVGDTKGAGAVYVFAHADGTWTETAKLTAGDAAQAAYFGRAVAVDGDTVVVGALVDVAENPSQGAAYIFRRVGNTWIETAKLTASDGAAHDSFGRSVAVSGDTVIVGAYVADVAGIFNRGAAYVFNKIGDAWTEAAKLVAADGGEGDRFGYSMVIQDDTLVIGANEANIGSNLNQGAVYLFTRTGGTWTQLAKLTAIDGMQNDLFGHSIALLDGTLLVGAAGARIGGNFSQGSMYVFTRAGDVWSQAAKLTASDGAVGDSFGASVALLGSTAFVGAPGHSVDGNPFEGAVYVSTGANETWTLATTLTAAAGTSEMSFGGAVVVADNTLFAGATGARAAYGFTEAGGGWTETTKLTAAFHQHFAEGATGFFHTDVGLFNPSETEVAQVLVSLNPESAERPVTVPLALQPLTRHTLDVNAAMDDQVGGVSVHVTSDQPVAATRQMQWDGRLTYGSTLESGSPDIVRTWYFAEGATYHSNLFYLIANPNDATAHVTIQYLLASGAPVPQEVVLPGQSRRTIWVNVLPGLGYAEMAAVISSDVPIIAERAMYFGQDFVSGATSRGATALSNDWFFAEGATTFFDTFLVLGNPGEPDAEVTVTYQLPDGDTLSKTHELPARSRRTILVDEEDPQLADTAVAMRLSSSVPIVAERAMWWGPSAEFWYEAHTALGATEAGTLWAIGEGVSGGPGAEDTYVLIANASGNETDLEVTVIGDDGARAQRRFALAGWERLTILVQDHFPEFQNQRFSVLVESLPEDSSLPERPITVEYARYQSTGRQFGRAGGAALATRVR